MTPLCSHFPLLILNHVMQTHKYKVGDSVVYQGMIGIIESCSTYAISGEPCYSLVAEGDPELTCTAAESKCTLYGGEEIDQEPDINAAHLNGMAIQGIVGGLTDKHFRDGNH